MNINQVMILGRVGKDPAMSEFKNGRKLAYFSVATSSSYKDENNKWVEKVEWHNVRCFISGLVDSVMKNIKKGDLVFVQGKLEAHEWTNSENTKIKDKIIMMEKFSKQYSIKSGDDHTYTDKNFKKTPDEAPTNDFMKSDLDNDPSVEIQEDDLPF
jgi:single-strand DNA-binding protein